MAKKNRGNCRICGEHGKLTFEHVPPAAAGNNPMGIELNVQQYIEDLKAGKKPSIESMRRMKRPRGSGGYYLCQRCNNNTGAWYVRDYAAWAAQGSHFRENLSDANSIALPFHILPARVYKQILAIFACTCGYGFFEATPFLRALVLNRDTQGIPDKLRLYCYIIDRGSKYSRQSGLTAMFSGTSRYTFAEFAFPPFGYILTVGESEPPDDALLDITFFANHGYNDYRDLHLPMPIRTLATHYPADFRSKTEVDATISRNQKAEDES